MRIGIIGKGFVGSAVEYGFTCEKNLNAEIKVFDINPKLKTHSLEDTINKSDYIFLSLPTPANPDGTIHLDIVDNALAEIDKSLNNDCIILLRSTVVPGTSQLFAKKYPKLQLVFNPEFLTEKNANYDFINQSRIILGGNKHLTEKVATLYNWRFDNSIPIIQTNYETAEFIKYVNNCFLATKVSFMNEMKLIANQIDIDWDKTIEGFTLDPRVGNSHVSVPGHDGKYGFGGSCLPKDMQALINFSESLNIDSKILKAAWDTNLKVRPEKDWETLEGRAVIDND